MDLSNLLNTNQPQTTEPHVEPTTPSTQPTDSAPPPSTPAIPVTPSTDSQSPTVPTTPPAVPVAPPSEPVTPPPVAPTQPSTPPITDGEVFEGKGSGKYRVVVLKDKCIGAASCVAVSPKTFELNDQQIAKVLPTVNTETDENLLLAAQSCPTLAIEVYDTTTGEKVWPK